MARDKRAEQFEDALARHRARAAEQELAEEQDRPLTPAEHQRRYRARQRGERVPDRKPGPKSREDKLRALLLEAQVRITDLERENKELREALGRRRPRR
jgi:hypothetical protein